MYGNCWPAATEKQDGYHEISSIYKKITKEFGWGRLTVKVLYKRCKQYRENKKYKHCF